MSLGPVMMGIEGATLAAEEAELLRDPQVGGVILFTRNFESVGQLAELTRSIHALRDPPLLVAVDQEGGRVQRFRNGFTPLPAIAQLGRLHDRSAADARRLAELSGWLMAVEMLAVGIDLSFAPVLDLDRGISSVIGDRAFHAEPRVVADLAHHYVRGMKRAGMAATGKHFPGHGSVGEDSHHELPVDLRDFAALSAEDLLPFERLVADGIEGIMAAHVLYPRIDDKPAGFSRFWLEDVLRGRLGFQGVIFSDDLLMEAANLAGDLAARAKSALDAGCDMVLVCRGADNAARVVEGLGQWSRPASRLRLARMHGRTGIDSDGLRRDPGWREAVERIIAIDETRTLDLI
jgi:beta-N-acetylhexosaminidase